MLVQRVEQRSFGVLLAKSQQPAGFSKKKKHKPVTDQQNGGLSCDFIFRGTSEKKKLHDKRGFSNLEKFYWSRPQGEFPIKDRLIGKSVL